MPPSPRTQPSTCSETDLRAQLRALLGDSQPSAARAPSGRRRPHPLYAPPGGGGSTAGKRRSCSQLQPASASGQRARSQPGSPIGVSKQAARPRGGATTKGRARGAASVGGSPVQPPFLPQLQAAETQPTQITVGAHHQPRQLRFDSQSQEVPSTIRSTPNEQQLASPRRQQAPPGHLLPTTDSCDPLASFARLRIVSPAASPQSSPQRVHSQAAPAAAAQPTLATAAAAPSPPLAAPGARQPGATSQWRWQQQLAAQAPPESPALPDSANENWCIAPSPEPASWQLGSPSAACQQVAAAAAGAAPPRAPPSPFTSIQERRAEIALLSEMAEDAVWSSQEEAEQAQQQLAGQAQDVPGPSAPAGSPPPWCSQAGSQVAGSSPQQPYICSFTSQELSELADPWSQPEEEAGASAAAAQQTQQQAAVQQMAVQQQQEQQPRHQQAPPAALQQQQQHMPLARGCAQWSGGTNQWAAVRPPAGMAGVAHAAAAPALLQRRPSADAQAAAATRRTREVAEDAMVDGTCPLPHLREVRDYFAAQREAFAAADEHNRAMPPRRTPHIVMSCVPEGQLLPVGGAAGGSATSGGSNRTAVADGQQGAGGAEQEADSAAAAERPADFLTRHRAGVLPAAGSSGYDMAPLAPLLAKRQRDDAAEDEERQRRQQQQQEARQQYQAALQALQQAVSAEVERQAAAAPVHGHTGSAGAAAGQDPAAAAGAAEAGEEEWRQEAVRTFCVERRARSGTHFRSFCAASYAAVWALFRRTRCEERHWYEVLREGRPAHLYFDLEYDPRLNPQADGDALVDCLLAHVAEQLRLHFGLALDPRCVYELDSSTPAKFSRHLTLRLPGHAFATNHAMGKFVGQVVAASGRKLFVVRGEHEGQAQLGPLVDMAVYSKNRHWRMSFCCKGGKAAVLLPTRRYATAPGATTSVAHVFLDTLVCNVDPRARLLQMPDPLPTHAARGSGGTGAGAGLAAVAVLDMGGQRQLAWKRDAADALLPAEQQLELRRLAEAALPFIERVATQRAGGAQARARTLAFCGAGATVAYSMIGPGSHYCEHIGRAHVSNHVFFVADFVSGAYAQKCHDPDCSRFRSGWMPLPPALCLSAAAAAALGLAPPPPSPSASSHRSADSR